jgi:hypothetical protein
MTKHKKIAEKKAPAAAKKVAAKAKATSKLGQLEGMLRRPEGATIPQPVKTVDWQAHSLRGAMSGSLKTEQGLKITTSRRKARSGLPVSPARSCMPYQPNPAWEAEKRSLV